jgi:hypothetical protein
VLGLSGAIETLLGAMEEERRTAVRDEAMESAKQFAQGDGSLNIPAVMLATAGEA